MPAYRVENAKTGRAKCKAMTCGHAVIGKDEIRQGTWVDVSGHGSFSWRHWGCVTARVIGNMREAIKNPTGELDFSLCDGYSDLANDASREIVKAALERGYVSDDAWNGASGGNRPNPPRAPRKKPVEEEDGDADAEGEGDPDAEGDDLEGEGALAGGGGDDAEAAPEVPQQEERAAAKEDADDDEEEAAPPVVKKGRGRPKKIFKEGAESSKNNTASQPPRKKGRPRKVPLPARDSAEDTEDAEPLKRDTATSRRKAQAKAEPVIPPRTSGRPRTSRVSYVEVNEPDEELEDEEPDEDDEPAPKKKVPGKRGRKPKGHKEAGAPPTKPTGEAKKTPGKRGRKPKAQKQKEAQEKDATEDAEASPDEMAQPKKVPGKRGRKPKAQKMVENQQALPPPPAPPPRARDATDEGASDQTEKMDVDAPPEEVEKPKRGRKPGSKKAAAVAHTAEKSLAVGRKRKAAPKGGDEDEDEADYADASAGEPAEQAKIVDEGEPKRKRGRPAAKKASDKTAAETAAKTVALANKKAAAAKKGLSSSPLPADDDSPLPAEIDPFVSGGGHGNSTSIFGGHDYD